MLMEQVHISVAIEGFFSTNSTDFGLFFKKEILYAASSSALINWSLPQKYFKILLRTYYY